MKLQFKSAMLSSLLGVLTATSQIPIFDENFDGGYAGAFGAGAYSGGNPTAASELFQVNGGNPNGC